MKFKILLIALFTMGFCQSQVNFTSAGGSSGIIRTGEEGLNIGFDFSRSEARFTYGYVEESSVWKYYMKNGDILYSNQIDPLEIDREKVDRKEAISISTNGSNLKLTVPLSNNSNTILSRGRFNPGIGIEYDFFYNPNTIAKNTRYEFVRLNYSVSQNRFGMIDQTDSIKIERRASHTFGFTLGSTWVKSIVPEKEDLLVSLSLAAQQHINPIVDLVSREFVTTQNTALNGFVTQTQEAFASTQEDFISLLPKLDFIWTPGIFLNGEGVEDYPRIGLIGSASSRFNTSTGRVANNFSIGPSLHPKWTSSAVIATIQFEFLDFTDSTGMKEFEDIFFINFYVGIPLRFR